MYVKPKKRLGQNFLVDPSIQRKIVDQCALSAQDVVLEIGSGRGELSRLIAPNVFKFYACEIDKRLLPQLKESLESFNNARIINEDILKVNLASLIKPIAGSIKVIGNIPYYISTPILERLFECGLPISEIYLTVQKEFAERVAACPGSKDYGSLSCFVRYYADPKIVFIIKSGSFYPKPKVDSAFIRITLRKDRLLNRIEEDKFFRIVRAAFNQRRKTLKNSLKNIIPPDALQGILSEMSVDPGIRPEMLSLEDFLTIAKKAKNQL